MPSPFLVFLCVALMLAATPVLSENSAQELRPKVVYFLYHPDTTTPWIHTIYTTAEVAAEDLGIDLEFAYSEHRYDDMLRSVKERVESGEPFDYALLVNQRGELLEVLKYLEQHQKKSFVLLSGLLDENIREIGKPGEKLEYWIGQLLPDDEMAGYDLAQELITRTRELKAPGEKIRLLGVTGSYSNQVAVERVRGLKRAVSEHDDVELLQMVSGRWQGIVLAQKYPYLLQRHKRIDAVWAANDNMALSLIDAPTIYEAEEGDSPPLVVGGMDWTSPAMIEIRDGDLNVSMGGHFIDVAYSLFLVKEHYFGRSFQESFGSLSLKSYLIPKSQDTAAHFEDYVVQRSEPPPIFNTDENQLRQSVVEDRISILSFIEAQQE